MTTYSVQPNLAYEDAIVRIVRALPRERAAQVLDFARFISAETSVAPIRTSSEFDAHQWGQIAVQSLAKFWDTPEEDEAWAHLQKAT
ncbi:MAG: hypothetical protein V9H69_05015 [Anaerolineae bacterium]